jgi:hemerythrin-like domain-containing protein
MATTVTKTRTAGQHKKNAARNATPRRTAARSSTSAVASAAEAVGRVVGATVNMVVSKATGSGPRDAITLLEDDHKTLKALLNRGEDLTDRAVKTRKELFDRVSSELAIHEQIEEKIFYPALKAHPKAKDIVLEGYQEHHVADLLVNELTRMSKSDERWGAKFKVLKENVEHHIEEEEGEMFKTARSVFSRAELRALGSRMEAMKRNP